MSFSLTIYNKEGDMDTILKDGFIHCEVTSALQPDKVFKYVYCVHCRRLHALSWMYTHSKSDPFVLTPRLAHLLTKSMFTFENDIRSETDLIIDS